MSLRIRLLLLCCFWLVACSESSPQDPPSASGGAEATQEESADEQPEAVAPALAPENTPPVNAGEETPPPAVVVPPAEPAITLTTATGAVFTKDTSNPLFGEAWKDPSGILWGDMIRGADGAITSTQVSAQQYCLEHRGRLPSRREAERLLQYLGQGSPQGYRPQVLPNLEHFFWIATPTGDLNCNSTWVHDRPNRGEAPRSPCVFKFSGQSGSVGPINKYSYIAGRCVSEPPAPPAANPGETDKQ